MGLTQFDFAVFALLLISAAIGYMRGAIRISALMKLPSLWIWTHDSIGLGEDGPTHQPVEHLAALRAMPASTLTRALTIGGITASRYDACCSSNHSRHGIDTTRTGMPCFESSA